MQAIEVLREKEEVSKAGRTVSGIVNSIETLEDGGFLVRRPFPKTSFSDFDPFLLLDEMGPMDVEPAKRKAHPIIRIADSRRSLICCQVIWNTKIPAAEPDVLNQAMYIG
jgi:hypothetical protein